MTRQQRRAAERREKKLGTLDQYFDKALRDVRAEFERTGGVEPGFLCVSDTEVFGVPGIWPDHGGAKAAACAALRDCFRRRGVKRYVFVSEGWVSGVPGLPPGDNSDRSECVQVSAVERNGSRKWAFAHVTRNGDTATLGLWELSDCIPQSWLMELLEEGHSDRAIKAEPAPLEQVSMIEAIKARDGAELRIELEDLAEAEQMQANPKSFFLALESVLRDVVKAMGSPKGVAELARVLRDNPDKFSMFSTIYGDPPPSTQHMQSCVTAMQRFISEKRDAGHEAIFGAFMNHYLFIGAQVVGALALAERIEDWSPERQDELRQVGLRSSYELDEAEGRVFLALSPGYFPNIIVGRSNAADDLFVSKVTTFDAPDFATAVEHIKQHGPDLVLGSEARELLGKMAKLGLVPPADPLKNDEEIWELENWDKDEWFEQTASEMVFAIGMNIQHVPEVDNPDGNVAGYRVRRAPNGLVLVPADNDDDVYVAVTVDRDTRSGCIIGWLRGSEG